MYESIYHCNAGKDQQNTKHHRQNKPACLCQIGSKKGSQLGEEGPNRVDKSDKINAESAACQQDKTTEHSSDAAEDNPHRSGDHLGKKDGVHADRQSVCQIPLISQYTVVKLGDNHHDSGDQQGDQQTSHNGAAADQSGNPLALEKQDVEDGHAQHRDKKRDKGVRH